MKKILYVATAAAALAAATACSQQHVTPQSDLDRLEEAYAQGRYAKAQTIADSLIIGSGFSRLDVYDLCRLSLALMHLGENSGESEVNTAFAARCIRAAVNRDSDSTAVYIKAMDIEDQARLMMLNAINEGSDTPVRPDSLYINEE